MNLLERTISEIAIPVTDISAKVRTAMTMQNGVDFGRLNDVLLRYIDITGERHPIPPQTSVVISCADHGVAAESVSAYPPETTLNMMCNYLIARGGAANAAANYADAQLIVADLGVNVEHTDTHGLLQHSIARGTANMTKGPAMTRAQAIQSIETGIAIANDCANRGDRCILPGEMGISNTTSSAAMVAAFLGLTPEEVTGRGANISDARLAHKVEIVRRALDVNRPNPHDGLDVLAKVGGFEFGCIAGLILGAAARRMLVILDGANTTSAALVAHALAPNCAHYLLASHSSLTEHSHPHALRHLGLTPILRLDIRLSEAAGSSIVLRLLGQMLKVWETIDTSADPPLPPRMARPPFPASEEGYDRAISASSAYGGRGEQRAPIGRIRLPNQSSMSACQYRLDNLAKPIHSLGYLERIAVQLAGVMHCERPPLDTQAALLLITEKKDLPIDLTRILNALTDARGIPVHILTSHDNEDAYAAAYRLAHTHPLLILGAHEQEDRTPITAALHGAASGGSLILPGDAQTDDIAHKTEVNSPAFTPHILHVLPNMLTIDTELTAGIAGLFAIDIVRAALHVVNYMKTFTETGVAVAIDGAGAGRQVKETLINSAAPS